MKFSREEVLLLEKGLLSCGEIHAEKITYAIAKSLNIVQTECKSIRKQLEPGEKYKEYDTKRIELCIEHAEKDDKGKPRINLLTNEYIFTDEGKEIFEKHLAVLREQCKEEIDKRAEEIKQNEKFLEEECELELHQVSSKYIPAGDMTVAMTNSIIRIFSD